jgi:DNA-binding GntR family transcriptional regulator
MSGALEPGQRLVLADVASEFGVSPTPVRDALRELERLRLVEGRPVIGYTVIEPSAEKLYGLCTLREALECQTARLCATNATDDDLRQLRQLGQTTDTATMAKETGVRLFEKETAFHGRIAQIAGIPELSGVLQSAFRLLGMFYKPWHHETGRTHADIVAAIETSDVDVAERVMRAHVHVERGEIEDIVEARSPRAGSIEPDRLGIA